MMAKVETGRKAVRFRTSLTLLKQRTHFSDQRKDAQFYADSLCLASTLSGHNAC
jgi:hypothetical protein